MNRAVLALLAAAAVGAQGSSWGPKDFGVLLLGGAEGRSVGALRGGLDKKYPVEFAFGLGDPKEIQRAIDRLTARSVKKLVAVPLVLDSESPGIEETQYVLGIRKEPSAPFFQGPHSHSGSAIVKRAKTKLPVVMTGGLDDHPLVAEILAARAKKMSERPERERIVLVAKGSSSDALNEMTERRLAALAKRVRELGRFSDAQAFVLRDDAGAPRPKKDKPIAAVVRDADKKLRDAVSALSRGGRVILLVHQLTPDGFERRIRKLLDGRFFIMNSDGLMLDPRLSKWVEAKVTESLDRPDMRQYKDEGRKVPYPEDKLKLKMDPATGRTRPSLVSPGSQGEHP
ncbi:MAG: hypothetical protein HY925_05375 [Elusimicrobia bacterium]|nr:hypothetical protein [Elusimicrobiota bacterium]